MGQNDRGMCLTAAQLGELFQCGGGKGVADGGGGQCDQDFVGMQTGVDAAQMVYLDGLDGGESLGRNQVDAVFDPGQLLQRVE